MSRGISTRARKFIQARATGNMTYTCRIERLAEPVFDEATSMMTSATATTIYTGVCRVFEVSGGAPITINEDAVVIQSTQLVIPFDATPVPVRDDEVVILTAQFDPALVGKRFRIMDAAKGGDLRASRRFTVQGVQEES